MTWWRRDLDKARRDADRAEQQHEMAVARRVQAERIQERAQRAENALRQELLRNGFTEALRAVFGGAA